MQERAMGLGWGKFWLRMAVSAGWLLASMKLGGALISDEYTTDVRVFAACLLALSVMVWLAVLQTRRKKADEFDGALVSLALESGARYALLFGSISIAAFVIEKGAAMAPGALEHQMLLVVSTQAPLAALYGEVAAQVKRWRLARPAR